MLFILIRKLVYISEFMIHGDIYKDLPESRLMKFKWHGSAVDICRERNNSNLKISILRGATGHETIQLNR